MGLNLEKLAKIKMLILDVDGVLTDTRVFMDSTGEWRRFFSVRDGAGIKRLIDNGYKVAIITGSKAEDIRDRVKVLNIHYLYEGYPNKVPAFADLLKVSGFSPDEMAYIGDDYFDIPILEKVAFAVTVPDAIEEVFPKVHYVTQRPGGAGAVREICDLIFKFGAYAQRIS